MEWTRPRTKAALAASAVIAVSVVALLGLPQAAGADHIAPHGLSHGATVSARGWFPPMAQRPFGPYNAGAARLANHAAGANGASHAAVPSAGAESASSGYAQGPAGGHWMHHCGFMPRYNQLRA